MLDVIKDTEFISDPVVSAPLNDHTVTEALEGTGRILRSMITPVTEALEGTTPKK